jgi:hypothetical protein
VNDLFLSTKVVEKLFKMKQQPATTMHLRMAPCIAHTQSL